MLLKESFIKSEVWMLTIGGAFQRANIYKSSQEEDKNGFKNELKKLVDSIVVSYSTTVSEEEYLSNIAKINSLQHSVLNSNHLNYGVSQKVLNLYLKYLWCLDAIPTPPHFPVDRIIQQELNYSPIVSWTRITCSEVYMKIINHAKLQAEKENCNLAELELRLFQRR